MTKKVTFTSEELNSIAWVNLEGQEFTVRQVLNFPEAYLNNIFKMVAHGGGDIKWKTNPNAINLLNKIENCIKGVNYDR